MNYKRLVLKTICKILPTIILKSDQSIPARSTTSITTKTSMTRKDDQYSLISRLLITMAHDFYMIMNGEKCPIGNMKTYVKAITDAGGDNTIVNQLLKIDATISVKDFKTLLRRIRRTLEAEEQELYKNGIRMVIRECLRL